MIYNTKLKKQINKKIFSPCRGALSLSCVKRVPPSLDLGLRASFFFSLFLVFDIMADDVADGLGNMKLTSDEGIFEVLESCSLSLIGKFLTCKLFNKRAAKNTLRRAWGLENSLQIIEVGPNLFQFKFLSEFDMARILQDGPWSFDNQLLLLQRW